MNRIFKSKLFWILSAAAAVVIFAGGMSRGGSYQSESRILLLPKSEKAVRNIRQIIANAEQIPLSLSFYDKLVEKNGDVEDEAMGLPDYKRKSFWNSKISVRQVGKSGVVRIIFSGENQFNAELFAKQTANDLALVMSRYYDIKNDLEIRTIDGPITRSVSTFSSWIKWISLGIILGVIFGFLISYLIYLLKKIELRKINLASRMNRMKDMFAKKDESKKEARLPGKGKKSVAPSNLPTGSEFIMESLERAAEKSAKGGPASGGEEEAKKPATHEATPEEVKERLNKLLRGGL